MQFTQIELQQCNKIATSSIIFLASTVVAKRGSRAVFGYMFKLLTVKTMNDRFFILFTTVVVVFTKNIYHLY